MSNEQCITTPDRECELFIASVDGDAAFFIRDFEHISVNTDATEAMPCSLNGELAASAC